MYAKTYGRWFLAGSLCVLAPLEACVNDNPAMDVLASNAIARDAIAVDAVATDESTRVALTRAPAADVVAATAPVAKVIVAKDPVAKVIVAKDPVAKVVVAKDPLQEVRDCMRRNIPKHSSAQTLSFASVDRIGNGRECEAKVLGMRQADGLRRMKVCMVKPADVRGIKLLSIEVPRGAPDTYLYLPETGRVKHLSGEGLGGRVCSSDVSYEDLNRQQQLNRAESLERLADVDLYGQSVYVLSSRPTDAAQSAYTKVISYVDKATCVVIKSESFERGETPRKVMIAKLDNLLEADGIRAPSQIVVTDLRDGTHTTVTADGLEIDDAVDKRSFGTDWLSAKRCR